MRIALVGNKLEARHDVAMLINRGYGYKRVRMDQGVERIYRFIYPRKKWTQVRWQDKTKLYDAFYETDNEIWVTYLSKRLDNTLRNVIVEDCRYVNEVVHLAKLGFKVVRVTAPKGGITLLGAGAGTITVHEYFNSNPAVGYPVDYALHSDGKESTKRAVDALMRNLTLVEDK